MSSIGLLSTENAQLARVDNDIIYTKSFKGAGTIYAHIIHKLLVPLKVALLRVLIYVLFKSCQLP